METYREFVKRQLRRANRSVAENYPCGGVTKLMAVAEYLLTHRDNEIRQGLAESLLRAAQCLDPQIRTRLCKATRLTEALLSSGWKEEANV